MKIKSPLLFYFLLMMLFSSAQASPLTPIKLDHPRDTMTSFYTAMSDYKTGMETNDKLKISRLNDAITCLNLDDVNPVIRTEVGKRAAIFLKEVMDRVILLDYSKIPDASENPSWRLKDTEIIIAKASEGERAGTYLFSPLTVQRAEEFYERVKNLPYVEGTTKGALYKDPLWQKVLPPWAVEKSIGLANWQWLGILVALLIGFIVKTIAEFFVLFIKKLSQRKQDDLHHKVVLAIESPIGLIAATGFWYAATIVLKLEGLALAVILSMVKVTFSVSLVWAVYNLSDVLVVYLERLTSRTTSTLDDQLVPLVSKALKVFVVVFGILLTIQNLGFNVMSLMAGLGLGGLAFALAAKDTAANLFGSIMILLDRPFKIGDLIKISSHEGTVEEIGFRSTRIRTLTSSVISIPNSMVANLGIDNLGMRKARKTVFTLGLVYGTSSESIEAFVEGIKNIILANPHTKKDYVHVAFSDFGDFSLNIGVYYYLELTEWADELVEKQNINIEILRLAEKIKVSFAFPTQSVFVEGAPGQPLLNPVTNLSPTELKSMADSFKAGGQNASPAGRGLFIANHKAPRPLN